MGGKGSLETLYLMCSTALSCTSCRGNDFNGNLYLRQTCLGAEEFLLFNLVVRVLVQRRRFSEVWRTESGTAVRRSAGRLRVAAHRLAGVGQCNGGQFGGVGWDPRTSTGVVVACPSFRMNKYDTINS